MRRLRVLLRRFLDQPVEETRDPLEASEERLERILG